MTGQVLTRLGGVVCMHTKDMEEPRCVAAGVLVSHYATRRAIKLGSLEAKGPRFGMGLSAICVGKRTTRDRWGLPSAVMAVLTLPGLAGEIPDMDRPRKSSTVKTRAHSLIRQSSMLFNSIPGMPEPSIGSWRPLRGHREPCQETPSSATPMAPRK